MPTISLTPLLGILVWTLIIVGVWYVIDEVLLGGRHRGPQ